MKKIKQIKGKLPLLLITAILILCAGFFIISCGVDPKLKGVVVDKGAYAVDFNQCPGTYCLGIASGSDTTPMVNISGKEITFEALIKKSASTAVTGAIFSRLDSVRGAALYVKNDEPKFAIKVMFGSTSSSSTSTAAYIVGAGTASNLVQNAWTHIAGVIANAVHTHTTTTDCTTAAMAETPHLDIYVNGGFKNCASTWGNTGAGDPATGAQFTHNPGSDKVYVGSIEGTCIDSTDNCVTDAGVAATNNLEAAIDELRLWTTARTAAQISECKDKELGYTGTCSRADSNLAAYYRLNEGTGATLTDFSGHGFAGALSYMDSANAEHEWEAAAWVAGDPDLARAD